MIHEVLVPELDLGENAKAGGHQTDIILCLCTVNQWKKLFFSFIILNG